MIKDLYAQPRTRKYRYRYTSSGKPARLVKFNPEQATFYLNTDHDLVAAYGDEPRALLLLENMVTAEAVLEVYLREHGMPAHVVGELLERRDSLLRGLANEAIFSLEAIGQLLRDSASDENDLEVNLVAASRALGFVATHLGSAGEPDGIARFSDYPNGEQKITLEAKSSGGIPELDQLDFAGLKRACRQLRGSGMPTRSAQISRRESRQLFCSFPKSPERKGFLLDCRPACRSCEGGRGSPHWSQRGSRNSSQQVLSSRCGRMR